jgi:NAD(P)-dependent dehydrogenase (short-subunit alcohol dehydrogenase family)
VPRSGLAPTSVAEAGAVLVDEIGFDQLSMGSLAERLGVKTPSLYKHVDSLADLTDIPARRTVDGFDAQTATNFLGPFVLTNLLLPSITDRVVSVASQLHRQAKLNIADLDWRSRDYNQMQAYRDSKLAVVLFSLELQRRLEESGSPVRSVLAHPGIATTTLAAHSKANRINSFRFLLNDAEHGALPTLFAATQDVVANAYVGPDGFGSIKGHPTVRKPGKAGLDETTARQLWVAAANLTGVGT